MKKIIVIFILINVSINLYGIVDTLPYKPFQFGTQIFYTKRLIDNGIVADNNLNISKDYRLAVDNYKNPPEGFYKTPKKYFGIEKTKILWNLNFTYSFNAYNSLSLFSEFCFKQHFIIITNNKSVYVTTSDFGDGMMNFVYFRRFQIHKKVKVKVGIGAGIIISPKNDQNNIFDVWETINFPQKIYNNMPAYYIGDYVFTTKEMYRNNIDLNLPLKISIDFTSKYKSYFSIVSGLNIIPYNYMGIEGNIYNYKTGELIKQEKFHYKHINLYFGLGYSFGWN